MIVEVPSLVITDDDRDFRDTLCEVFEPRGFRTLPAEDGIHALEIVAREPVHLVLLDMHMPRLTGLETLRRLKQTHMLLPCILLSANMTDQLAAEAKQARAFSVLSKPVGFSEVTHTVAEALRQAYGWPNCAESR